MVNKILEWIVKDDKLRSKRFESFELAALEAIQLSDVDVMTTLVLPDGNEYTILKRPKSGKT